MNRLEVNPVGIIKVSDKGMYIQIDKQYVPALKGLEGFSHLQTIWWFSELDNSTMRTVIETPKPYKKGPDRIGIFATRSPVRPNPIALSTVEVMDIDYNNGLIQVAWIDANDSSPVLDIKPYTPSADRVEKPSTPEWCEHWPLSYETSGYFNWKDEFNF